MYDPRDALTDTVATLVFMPSKFDRSTMQLAEKINSATPDLETLNVSRVHITSVLHKDSFTSSRYGFLYEKSLGFKGIPLM